jgi:hypothetical protein
MEQINGYKLKLRFFLFLLPLLQIWAVPSSAQDAEQGQDSTKNGALNVLITFDDDDFSSDLFKKEIPIINYVRDQKDAHVYIIGTSQRTGAGGYEYTFFLMGQHDFAGMVDTLKYSSRPADTVEKTRDGQISILKMGLMRYIMHTPLSGSVEISFTEQEQEDVNIDAWNNWVIRFFMGGTLRGEKSSNLSNIWGGFGVEKVTEDWKIQITPDFGYTVQKFELEEGDVTSIRKLVSFDALIVKSIGEHWSVGGQALFGSFSYSNYKLKTYIHPAIEFDIFPYSESTRKQIRILYSAGPVYQIYNDTTIYNKINEMLWGQRLNIAAEVVQKWGSLDASLGWRNYFHDWSKNFLSFNGSLNLRVAKGLSISLRAGASVIHNQLSLPAAGASDEDILLQQKELETQYSYFTNITLSYTIGSIYNNVVNPRFENLHRW